MKIINWLLQPFRKLRRRWIIAKAYPKMEKAFQNQVKERRTLRKQINNFLREYFGVDANSKYIPKDYKNKDEVRVAVCDKFQPEMDRLNLKYTDLFS